MTPSSPLEAGRTLTRSSQRSAGIREEAVQTHLRACAARLRLRTLHSRPSCQVALHPLRSCKALYICPPDVHPIRGEPMAIQDTPQDIPQDTIANSTVPQDSSAQWTDKKRYLWLIGLVVPSLAARRLRRPRADRVGSVALDRADHHPGRRTRHRPVRRPRPVQPAGRRHRAARERQVLPVDHLRLPPDPVRRLRGGVRLDRRARMARRRRALPVGQARRRDLHRLHRRHRDQHRPRARPQEGEPRALAVQDRPGAELLRPLLHRAQPRAPRARGHPRGPGQQPDGRELLPVLAAHRLPAR